MHLANEHKLVLLGGRMSNVDMDEIKGLINTSIDWFKVIECAHKNKVLFLLYNNLVNGGFKNQVPKAIISLVEDALACNIIRNNEKLAEMKKIQTDMYQAGILFVPVKGGYMIDNVYHNRGVRTTNDIDALIRRQDIGRVHEIMCSNGYICGEYCSETNSVIEPDKVKKVLYKTKMYNLLPYVKIYDGVPNRAVIFDLSFALDFSLDTDPVDEMLDCAALDEDSLELQPEHYFVHMCCHHYREASNVAWILIGKDLTLMKFCDVREFLIQKMTGSTIEKAIRFAKKHKLEKAIYFTVYFLREIFSDGYETGILEALDIEDETFLFQFGEKDYGKAVDRKKDFWQSLFDNNNLDEITVPPKFHELV